MKGRAPVSTEILKVKLPRPAEADLPNGLHVMVLEDRRLPQVSFQLLIPGAGGYFDPADLPGLAVVTAAMMREGTTTRTTQQISELLETKAATVAVTSGLVAPRRRCPARASPRTSRTRSRSRPTSCSTRRSRRTSWIAISTRTRAGLVSQRTSPGFLASEMMSKILYGAHPASRISLTDEGLTKITRDALVSAHRARFVPDHADDRHRRRHLDGRGAEADRRAARRVEEGRDRGAGRDRSAGDRPRHASRSSPGPIRCRRRSGSARRRSTA